MGWLTIRFTGVHPSSRQDTRGTKGEIQDRKKAVERGFSDQPTPCSLRSRSCANRRMILAREDRRGHAEEWPNYLLWIVNIAPSTFLSIVTLEKPSHDELVQAGSEQRIDQETAFGDILVAAPTSTPSDCVRPRGIGSGGVGTPECSRTPPPGTLRRRIPSECQRPDTGIHPPVHRRERTSL